jgi:hypothetical protein
MDLHQSHCHFKSHMKFSFCSLNSFLPLFSSCQFRRPDSIKFPAGWLLETQLFSIATNSTQVLFSTVLCQSQSQSYVTTDGQSASLSWNKVPIWGLRPDFYYCLTVTGFLMSGALSDERTGLSFARVIVRSSKSFVSMYNLHFTCY